MSSRPSPAQRAMLLHMHTTGGYMVGDPVNIYQPDQVIASMADKGWVTVEKDGTAILTAMGRAAYAWRTE